LWKTTLAPSTFKSRAQKTEAALPTWGKSLFDAIQADISTKAPLDAWLIQTDHQRFSVEVVAQSSGHTDEASSD
jgi:2-keto-3-deoxy-L-rhamnonate aldolase RhmA